MNSLIGAFGLLVLLHGVNGRNCDRDMNGVYPMPLIVSDCEETLRLMTNFSLYRYLEFGFMHTINADHATEVDIDFDLCRALKISTSAGKPAVTIEVGNTSKTFNLPHIYVRYSQSQGLIVNGEWVTDVPCPITLLEPGVTQMIEFQLTASGASANRLHFGPVHSFEEIPSGRPTVLYHGGNVSDDGDVIQPSDGKTATWVYILVPILILVGSLIGSPVVYLFLRIFAKGNNNPKDSKPKASKKSKKKAGKTKDTTESKSKKSKKSKKTKKTKKSKDSKKSTKASAKSKRGKNDSSSSSGNINTNTKKSNEEFAPMSSYKG